MRRISAREVVSTTEAVRVLLLPSKEMEAEMEEELGRANRLREWVDRHLREVGRWPGSRDLTVWRASDPHLSAGSARALHGTLHTLRKWGTRAGEGWFHVSDRVWLESGRIRWSGARGWVDVTPALGQVDGRLTSVRVKREEWGGWSADLGFRVERAEPVKPGRSVVGFDLGLSATATASDPECSLHRLETWEDQEWLWECVRRADGPDRFLAGLEVFRRTFTQARRWARGVVSRFDVVAVEDLDLTLLDRLPFTSKTRMMEVAHVKRALIVEGLLSGCRVILVNPAYTTTTCSRCGWCRDGRLPLAQRTFTCERCDLLLGRDLNAALNVAEVARSTVGWTA